MKLDKVTIKAIKTIGEIINLDNSYIAGGCALDLYMDKKPKDVDIFVQWNASTISYELLIGLYMSGRYLYNGLHIKEKGKEYRTNKASRVLEVYVPKGISLDIILIQQSFNLDKLLSEFDVSIAKGYLDKRFNPVLTQDALRSLKEEIVTVNSKERTIFGDHTNNETRVARYKSKYPQFRYVKEL